MIVSHIEKAVSPRICGRVFAVATVCMLVLFAAIRIFLSSMEWPRGRLASLDAREGAGEHVSAVRSDGIRDASAVTAETARRTPGRSRFEEVEGAFSGTGKGSGSGKGRASR